MLTCQARSIRHISDSKNKNFNPLLGATGRWDPVGGSERTAVKPKSKYTGCRTEPLDR